MLEKNILDLLRRNLKILINKPRKILKFIINFKYI